MIKRNNGFASLKDGYLFPEIAKRRREFQAAHPEAKIISLGIGNTTEPLAPVIAKGMADYCMSLATKEGYSGYGDEQGLTELRQKIAKVMYNGIVSDDEVFISDGAKCDIARIQTLFGADVQISVQDPAYPVYVDGSTIAGVKNINYLPCTPENNFFPDLSSVKKDSLIYFCSPNNPTGAVATKAQLKSLVDFANANGCIIIFDSAYSEFIQDKDLPKSIFEIEGARTCAIEINSYSKPAGFTGVRLGWSVVPKELVYADGSSVNRDWNRVMTTLFNGASNVAQHGGLACLSDEGIKAMKDVIQYYLRNAKLIEETVRGENFKKANAEVYFTGNSPYVWVKFPGKKSWDIFDKLLNECNVITTPGSGFGPAGESFVRISAFGHYEDVQEACKRLSTLTF